MKDVINIEVVLDSKYKDPKVTIFTDRRTEEVEQIIDAIENSGLVSCPPITASKNDVTTNVHQRNIIRAVVDKRSTLLYCDDDVYTVKKTLSEVETTLSTDRFVRISQSEIINLRKVRGFDLSVLGTIGIEFEDGTRSWVARRYVKALRETLTRAGTPSVSGAKEETKGGREDEI